METAIEGSGSASCLNRKPPIPESCRIEDQFSWLFPTDSSASATAAVSHLARFRAKDFLEIQGGGPRFCLVLEDSVWVCVFFEA